MYALENINEITSLNVNANEFVPKSVVAITAAETIANKYNSDWSNNLSLYIPVMNTYINEERITHIFHSLYLGKVHHVDYIHKIQNNSGHTYMSAYIHFDEWYTTKASKHFQEKAICENGTRLVYDDPCYWVVFANKSQKLQYKRKHLAMFDLSELEEGELNEDASQEKRDNEDMDNLLYEMNAFREIEHGGDQYETMQHIDISHLLQPVSTGNYDGWY
jgi:hypothetical protein